jgi:hypothetical protein
MSIRIPSPSVVLNTDAWDVSNFTMDVSIEVPSETRIHEVFASVANDCKRLKTESDGQYLTFIINAHGYYASVDDGPTFDPGGYGGQRTHLIPGFGIAIGTGIRQANAYIFGKLAPYVDKIIINSCGVAGISNPGGSDGDGNLLCSSIAQHAKALVQASQSLQKPNSIFREDPGFIDDWEGVVLTYASDGSVMQVDRYA